MNPLTQQTLDRAACQNPRCDHTDCDALYLRAACHQHVPPMVHYTKSTGVLTFECSVCGEVVAQIEVAP